MKTLHKGSVMIGLFMVIMIVFATNLLVYKIIEDNYTIILNQYFLQSKDFILQSLIYCGTQLISSKEDIAQLQKRMIKKRANWAIQGVLHTVVITLSYYKERSFSVIAKIKNNSQTIGTCSCVVALDNTEKKKITQWNMV